MLQRPAAVAVHFLSDRRWPARIWRTAILWVALAAGTAQAMPPESRQAVLSEDTHLLARINLHSEDELNRFLSRAEALLDGSDSFEISHPIAVVLHGPEVDFFAFGNYQQHKPLVDKAAQLDALGIIDVKVCETYMRSKGIEASEMPPYVEVVPYGPGLEAELIREGYVAY